MQSWGTAREVEKVKPKTKAERRAMLHDRCVAAAGALRTYVSAFGVVGTAPRMAADLGNVAKLLDELAGELA